MTINHNRLNEFVNESQVWLLMIKKEHYEKEYEKSLLTTLQNLRDLLLFLQDQKEEQPDLFLLKQNVMRLQGTHELLFNLLKEGTIIYELLFQILNGSQKNIQSFRLDIFVEILNLFYVCHRLLCFFCENNLPNQQLLFDNLRIFLPNTFVNFG
jgi:hypothetical protein